MIQQPTFWDQAGEIHVDRGAASSATLAPPKTITNTRKMAYEATERFRRSTLAIVFEFIRGRGEHGAIDEEIEELAVSLGKRPSTGRCRRVDLASERRILDSGRRRPTSTGHDAIVWVVAPVDL